jgi:RNA polymerase subunit RPABC4/transcription elongation factor Spt4
MTDDNTCPRCKHGIPNDERRGEYVGALSRLDDETYICSACGTDEAMFNWLWPNRTLPPLNQEVPR